MSKEGFQEDRDWAIRNAVAHLETGSDTRSDLIAIKETLLSIACSLAALVMQGEAENAESEGDGQ